MRVTLAANIGTIDNERFGLTETLEGKTVDASAEAADELIKRGWAVPAENPKPAAGKAANA